MGNYSLKFYFKMTLITLSSVIVSTPRAAGSALRSATACRGLYCCWGSALKAAEQGAHYGVGRPAGVCTAAGAAH